MMGVTTHISAPKSNTDCATALNKKPCNHGLAPSLHRILVILLQTADAFVRFRITSGQSSSAAYSTPLRYLKDRTIFRLRP